MFVELTWLVESEKAVGEMHLILCLLLENFPLTSGFVFNNYLFGMIYNESIFPCSVLPALLHNV